VRIAVQVAVGDDDQHLFGRRGPADEPAGADPRVRIRAELDTVFVAGHLWLGAARELDDRLDVLDAALAERHSA
jgi:hypothetical protein